MKKQYTKKQIEEAIAYWQKQLNETEQLNEARHDGKWLPKHPTHRNPTDKPTVYYLGVDDSDDFRGYGSYIMPNGGLTRGASNSDFKSAAVTKVPILFIIWYIYFILLIRHKIIIITSFIIFMIQIPIPI